jgi:phosphate-selective porin OprO/OprP
MKQVKFSARSATSAAVAILCLGASAAAFAQVEAKVTGRVHFDARNIDNSLNAMADRDSASVGDTFELRRARIGVVGTINKDIGYEIVGNAVGGTTNWIDTAWANYGFNKNAQVRVGRFKQPFSLEELTSSNNIDFMERSYGNQMVPGKRLGAMMHGEPMAGLTYGVSVYQDGFNELTNQNSLGTKQAARLTLNLAQIKDMKDTVLHVGLGYTGGESQVTPTNSGNTQEAAKRETRATIVSMRTENRGLANAYRAQIGGDYLMAATNTAAAGSVTGGLDYGQTANNAITINQKLRGLELAGANGPFKFQMETFNSKYAASGTIQNLASPATTALNTMGVQVKAQYIELMYNITGESWADAYKGGAFGGIKPKTNFMTDYGGVVGNGTGAWQVGFRTSKYVADTPVTGSSATCLGTAASPKCEMDVSGANVDGTKSYNRIQNAESATTNTYALNWILNSNARIMFNYAETKFAHNVIILDTNVSSNALNSGATDKERVISVRTQINF